MAWVRVEGSSKYEWVSPKAARGIERAVREDLAMQTPEEADAKARDGTNPSTPTVRAVEIVSQTPPNRKRYNPLPEDLEEAIATLRQALTGARAGSRELEDVYLRSTLTLIESDNLFARTKGAAALLKLMESRRKQQVMRAQAQRERAYTERLRRGVNALNSAHVDELLAKQRPRIGVPKRQE